MRVHLGEYAGAMEDFTAALRAAPSSVAALTGRVLLAAACPDARLRDGRRAVEDAGRACELTGWKAFDALTAMAAAAAEHGDFEAATKAARRAASPEVTATPGQKQQARAHLKLYKAKKPLRMTGGVT